MRTFCNGFNVGLLLGVAVLVAALTLANPAHADYFQSWQTVSLKWIDTKYLTLTTAVHTRMTDDSVDFSLWRVGQVVSMGLAFSR